MTAPSTAPPLELGSSSVTVLRSGADFVVAAGLCGWLRAWQLRAEPPSKEVCTAPGCLLLHNPHTDTLLSLSLSLSLSLFLHLRYYLPSVQAWVLVLDERSTYDLPNGRTSSHPFRFVALA